MLYFNIQTPVRVKPAQCLCPDGDLLDLAYQWGLEDALGREDMGGSEFFVGAALAAYNAGYGEGLEQRRAITGPSDELAFMAGVLESLRGGVVPVECQLADAWLEN